MISHVLHDIDDINYDKAAHFCKLYMKISIKSFAILVFFFCKNGQFGLKIPRSFDGRTTHLLLEKLSFGPDLIIIINNFYSQKTR